MNSSNIFKKLTLAALIASCSGSIILAMQNDAGAEAQNQSANTTPMDIDTANSVNQPEAQQVAIPSCGFEELAPDTIQHILSYLTIKDVTNISSTCKALRSLAIEPRLMDILGRIDQAIRNRTPIELPIIKVAFIITLRNSPIEKNKQLAQQCLNKYFRNFVLGFGIDMINPENGETINATRINANIIIALYDAAAKRNSSSVISFLTEPSDELTNMCKGFPPHFFYKYVKQDRRSDYGCENIYSSPKRISKEQTPFQTILENHRPLLLKRAADQPASKLTGQPQAKRKMTASNKPSTCSIIQ